MKNRYFLNSISFLFLAIMLFKASFFHAYTHHDANADDIKTCKICELAIENDNDKFVIVTPTIVTTPIFITNTYEPIVFYDLVLSSSSISASLFGRPPPRIG